MTPASETNAQSFWQQLQNMANSASLLHATHPEWSTAKKTAIIRNAIETNHFGADLRAFFCTSAAPVVTSVNHPANFVNPSSQFPGHGYPLYNHPSLYLHGSPTLSHAQTGTINPATLLSVSDSSYGVFTAQLHGDDGDSENAFPEADFEKTTASYYMTNVLGGMLDLTPQDLHDACQTPLTYSFDSREGYTTSYRQY